MEVVQESMIEDTGKRDDREPSGLEVDEGVDEGPEEDEEMVAELLEDSVLDSVGLSNNTAVAVNEAVGLEEISVEEEADSARQRRQWL